MRGNANWMLTVNMRPLALIGLLFVFSCHVDSMSSKLPCHFHDSVNITAGEFLSNKSIIFDGVEFGEGQYAELDYILDGNEQVPAHSHLRGCLCNRRPCIRLCCPIGSLPQIKNGSQVCSPHEDAKNPEHALLDQNNVSISVKLDQHFSIVDTKPCQKLYIADADYQITHNGHILYEDQTLEHHQYCIRAKLNKTQNSIDWNLLVCYEPDDVQTVNGSRFVILPICMLISVLFIIATLFVYGCIPKLRNLNGKCLMCYLAALAVGYTLLSSLQINGSRHIDSSICSSIAHLIYVSLLSAFLWLNVINFDLWMTFQSSTGFNRMTERKRFFVYSLYGFGVPCFLTLMISIVDQIESIPNHLRPRMATHTCFLHEDWLTRLIFFYVPLGIIMLLNVVLYILTARRISQMQQEVITMNSQEDYSKIHRSLNKKRESVILYLRLFVIAGMGWVLEVVSFLVAADSPIFLLSDIWNCLQGVLIFILLIMRRRVFRLIKERWNDLRGKTNPNENTGTNSNASNYYLRLNSISSPR